MVSKLFLLYCFFFIGQCFSQNETYTLQLFYDKNEVGSQQHLLRLDSLLSALSNKTYNIKIYGYADFLHTSVYNTELSQKRADVVKTHLLTKTSAPQMNILTSKGFGEQYSKDNNSTKGEPYQRRVDIIVEIQSPVKKIDTRAIPITKPLDPDNAPKSLIEVEEGGTFVLKGLEFEPGRHKLLKTSVPIVEDLLKSLEENPGLRIEIQGHVCCTPGELDAIDIDTNEKKLSENRAKAIYSFLVRRGINRERLKFKGYAHSRPLVPEISKENEQKNRRVEILVLEK